MISSDVSLLLNLQLLKLYCRYLCFKFQTGASMEVREAKNISTTSSSSGKLPLTLTVVVLVVVLLLLILAIVLGSEIFTPSTGWGQWSSEVRGPCVPQDALICDGKGLETSTKFCIPNSETGRGCLDQNGNQTFRPQRSTTQCKLVCLSSKWKIERGICNPPPDPSLTMAGTRRVSMECVSTGFNGRPGCYATTTSGTGTSQISRSYAQYQVGQTITWNEICYSYTRPRSSRWGLKLPPELGATTLEVDQGSRFEGPYLPSPVCITGDEDRFAVLEEGLMVAPVRKLREMDPSQAGNSSLEAQDNLEAQDWNSNQIPCEERRLKPWQLRTRELPLDFQNLACPGTYLEGPASLIPCRYFPSQPHRYNRGTDFDLLISSFLLPMTEDGRPLVPLRLPSRLRSNGLETSSSEISTSTPLSPVAITGLNSQGPEDRNCSFESISFNTGLMLVVAPRSLTPSGPGCFCNIGALISLSFRGWLGLDKHRNLVWQQASSGPRDPGLTSSEAFRFRIEMVGPISSASQAWSNTKSSNDSQPSNILANCSGTTTVSISAEDGGSPYIRVDGIRRQISRLRVLLYPLGSELCTRALQGPRSCNLLLRDLPEQQFQGCI